jgi:NAD(P)H dehydrogenase (quinone)
MTTEGVGGSPYGPSTMPREESDVEAPTTPEIETARSLGERVTRVAARLRATDETPVDAETASA